MKDTATCPGGRRCGSTKSGSWQILSESPIIIVNCNLDLADSSRVGGSLAWYTCCGSQSQLESERTSEQARKKSLATSWNTTAVYDTRDT